jgi:Uma2 family endonuclease
MQSTVHLVHPISDDDLVRFARENPGWCVERAGNGSLRMSPTFAAGGAKNAELTYQLVAYAKRYGGVSFNSNVGFTLPDDSVFSPDGSWISDARWATVPEDVRDSYTPIVPDIWIELRSKIDRVVELKAKLEVVRSFGAAFVLLIDPYERTTWSQGQAPPEFALDLAAIYDA